MTKDSLSDFIEEVCGESHLRVETDLGGGFVRLCTSEAQRRQAAHDIRSTEDIVIEMLRNARDAHACNIFLAFTRDSQSRKLVMLDDGDGIPTSMHETIFEPRVTSKLNSFHVDKWGVHGRGMALYSIAVNAKSAYVVTSDLKKGTSFSVETNLINLPEKTDQSTFPTFFLNESNKVSIRGPKNILRSACEFAIESRDTCNVFIGSTTDIAATLYYYGTTSLSSSSRIFCNDSSQLEVCKRLAIAADPACFSREAKALGLELSERSARRILDSEIKPLEPLLNQITIQELHTSSKTQREANNSKPQLDSLDQRNVKITLEDTQDFVNSITCAYQDLARDYFLEPDISPLVSISKREISIKIPLHKLR